MYKEPETRWGLNSANPTERSQYCQVRPQAFDPEVIYLPRDLWGTRGDGGICGREMGGEEELGWFLGNGGFNTYVVVHVQLVK